MACGKPVIVSTGAAVQEILEDGKTAFLVPPRRPDAIAAELGKLIDGPALRKEIAARGRQHVLDTLSWPGYARTMLGIFEESVASLRGESHSVPQGHLRLASTAPREAAESSEVKRSTASQR
jgi:glycosyltransferase involved in cell wall biosynthesis